MEQITWPNFLLSAFFPDVGKRTKRPNIHPSDHRPCLWAVLQDRTPAAVAPAQRREPGALVSLKGDSIMKSTGIVRGIDALGRIVLPKELRTNMRLETDTKLEIFVDGRSEEHTSELQSRE